MIQYGGEEGEFMFVLFQLFVFRIALADASCSLCEEALSAFYLPLQLVLYPVIPIKSKDEKRVTFFKLKLH